MLNTTSDTDLEVYLHNPRIAEIADFLAREQDALVELLETLGEFEAAEAARNAARLSAAQTTDLEGLGNDLVQVLNGLDSIPLAVVEHMMFAGLGPRDAHAAIRWAGARLTDLLGILETA